MVIKMSKIYFSFRTRVIILVFTIVILFGTGCFLASEYVKLFKGDRINYDEISDVEYSVCLKQNDIYDKECLASGMKYASSIVDKIKTKLSYKVDFSEDINYDISYHIIAYNRIYDKNDKKRLLYESSDLLKEKTKVTGNNKNIDISDNVDVDFDKYNSFANNYKVKYSEDSLAKLDIILYIDEYDEEREAASISIPLGKNNFSISKRKISNMNKYVEIENKEKEKKGMLLLTIGSFLIGLSLLFDIKLVKLVKSTFAKKSKYDYKLEEILKKYDDKIVNVKEDIEYDDTKNIVKVEDIKELIDASNITNKPVLYAKINNIKSEFIVDGDNTVYKFILKEADLEGETEE